MWLELGDLFFISFIWFDGPSHLTLPVPARQVVSKDADGTYTVRFRSTKVPGGGARMKESGVPESDLREVRITRPVGGMYCSLLSILCLGGELKGVLAPVQRIC